MNPLDELATARGPDLSETTLDRAERNKREKAERERRIAAYIELAEQRKPIGGLPTDGRIG